MAPFSVSRHACLHVALRTYLSCSPLSFGAGLLGVGSCGDVVGVVEHGVSEQSLMPGFGISSRRQVLVALRAAAWRAFWALWLRTARS